MHKKDILSDLTDAQREAVTHVDGPLLVLAGAGSGKTRVVTRRVAYLLDRGVKPWHMLAITFTNKAAGEMKERVAALTPAKGLRISTFHAFCARELRRFAEKLGISRSYTIYDTSDRTKLIRDCMSALEIDPKELKASSVETTISNAKNRMQSPEQYGAVSKTYYEERVAKIYARYETEMRTCNALDFDDLLLRMVVLLSDDESQAVLASQFRYVMVDEYQDTNVAQYRIIRRLTETHRNLCVTGDPDQAIYGWRGADIQNILSFERDYPGAKTVLLDRNYRSTQTILDAAHDLIAHNEMRKEKTLVTENPVGSRVTLLETTDEIEEAREVAASVRSLIADGMKPHDVAVFYRINALSRTLEMQFRRASIPYRVVAGTAFFDRKEVRDLLAYLRLVANPADDLACERIVNVPTRGIGKTSLAHVKAFAAAEGLSLYEALVRGGDIEGLTSAARKAIASFVELVAVLSRQDEAGPEALLKDLFECTGYLKTFTAGDEDQKRLRNVDELVNVAATYEESTEEPTLIGFLEEVALVSDQDGLDDRSPTVSLMTLHAAKGLEFPAVFVVGLEEGLLPHERANVSAAELEEERRLLYVGMTRAKRELTLSYAFRRRRFGTFLQTEPSRFVAEIAPERFREVVPTPPASGKPAQPPSPRERTSTLAVGDVVRSPSFGVGTIRSVSGSGDKLKAVVEFETVGTKTLMVAFAKLEKLQAEG